MSDLGRGNVGAFRRLLVESRWSGFVLLSSWLFVVVAVWGGLNFDQERLRGVRLLHNQQQH